jgi:hypothetical protein
MDGIGPPVRGHSSVVHLLRTFVDFDCMHLKPCRTHKLHFIDIVCPNLLPFTNQDSDNGGGISPGSATFS